MLEVKRVEEKTKEDALKKVLETLNTNESEIYYFFEETEGSLFKSKKVIVNAVTKYEVKQFIKNYINEFAKKINIMINSEIVIKPQGISVVLISDKNGILIGKDGKNLAAFQALLRQTLKKYGRFNLKINVDIANYKAKRERNIEYEVKKLAKEVSKTKIAVKLDPMNSYERRIVHTIVSDFSNLVTESEGVSPNRYVVIKYEEDAN